MILEIRVENCFAFSQQIIFSLVADMRNKKLSSNVHKINNFNVLKTAGIYGANNVGKSCFVKAIRAIQHVMLNKSNEIQQNIFTENSISSMGITFLYKGVKYSYDFQYDGKKQEFVYEKFIKIRKDEFGNESEIVYLIRDKINNKYYFTDNKLAVMLPMMSQSNIAIYLIDAEKSEKLSQMKNIFIGFASKIDIVSMTNIPMRKTIDLLKNKYNLQQKVVDFIKHADLDLEDYFYADHDEHSLKVEFLEDGKPYEDVLNIPSNIMDQIRLTSKYKGVLVPSLLFDSTGTKKVAALSSYIIEALEYGRILIIDELDSGLHFKLTRAIVSMFNNELNNQSQMVFTVHDINLMDCKALFRKEQVWFLDKDAQGVYLYSLSDFTAQDGVRDTSNVIEKYKKGLLGAVPEPTLIKTLLQLDTDRKEERLDE